MSVTNTRRRDSSIGNSISREEKKIALLAKLARKQKIGMNYIPKQKSYSKIPSHARGGLDGILDEMWRDALIEFHKGRKCISINPGSLDEVTSMIEGEVPDYILKKLR
ncbi:MAG: hypothetical protein ABEJ03_05990 [Candidatus Nanohaloarchaea archaeon]